MQQALSPRKSTSSVSPAPLSRRLVLTAALLGLISGIPSGAAAADEESQTAPPPSSDDVWLISTRWSRHYAHPRLRTWVKMEGRWLPSSTDEFFAGDDPNLPTVFWIHGDRVDHWESASVGLAVHRKLKKWSKGRPFRFVIWSWPSSRVSHGPLKDPRIKAARSDREALSLAWFIDRLEPSVKVSLIGYSYGARIATGALHLLAGGRLVGYTQHERIHPVRAQMRAALTAAALDDFSLARGQRNGLALAQVDQMLNLYNPCDRVLRFYPLLKGLHGGPDAAGYTGLTGYFGEHADKVRQMNVSRYTGKKHDWRPYFSYATPASMIAATALFLDTAGDPEKNPAEEPLANAVDALLPAARLPFRPPLNLRR